MRKKFNGTDDSKSDNEWFDPNDPRSMHLNKLQNIGTNCSIAAVLCTFVGYFGPSEWRTDIGILVFILLFLWIAASLYSNFLAKRWGIKTAEDKKTEK